MPASHQGIIALFCAFHPSYGWWLAWTCIPHLRFYRLPPSVVAQACADALVPKLQTSSLDCFPYGVNASFSNTSNMARIRIMIYKMSISKSIHCINVYEDLPDGLILSIRLLWQRSNLHLLHLPASWPNPQLAIKETKENGMRHLLWYT